MIRRINIKHLTGVVVLAFLITVPVGAQSLDDWKEALNASKNGKGCESIPYSGLRSDCQGKSSKVNDLCKTESWSCDGLETKSLRNTMQNLSEYLTRLKEEKDRLSSQRSSASTDDEKNDLDKRIKEIENKLYDKTRELDDMKNRLDRDVKEADNRLYKGNQCMEAREDVQEVFTNARSSARSESDADIKVIASQLADYWEEVAKKHQTAFDDVKRGMEKCEKCKRGDL